MPASPAVPSPYPTLHISGHPLIADFMTRLANECTGHASFRALVRKVTTLLLYEATAQLPLRDVPFRTPLEETTGQLLAVRLGLVPILRAGLGMVEPAIDALPDAEVWHLGLYRDEHTKQPVSYYNRLPERCPDDHVFVLDPMLATGGSASDAVDVLKNWGAPSISFVGLIAAPAGVERMLARHPDVNIHVAALHRELDANAFIRPGLGDAGDRLFAT